jgi:omega-amidase
MKVYGVQHDIAWEDQPANCHRVRAIIAQECPESGSLIILPEMFATGFSMDSEATATTTETTQTLIQIARDYNVHVMAGTVSSQGGEKAQNKAVVYSPAGRLCCEYVKQQPFNLGGEGEAYVSGDTHVLFDWNGIQVAPFICYDLRFPEVFRPAAAAGAELMTVIASWPEKRIHHWVHLLRARAIENQCHVVGVNRIGSDPGLNYNGRTIIVDYTGEIIADAAEDQGVIFADLDFATQREYRKNLPFLPDMKSAGAA